MRSIPLAAFVMTLACGLAAAADPDDFAEFSIDGLPGRLYTPDKAGDSRRPLIVFLHGAGETGDDNLLQINRNIDNLLGAAKERRAFLYAPQAVERSWRDEARTDKVLSQIDKLLAEKKIDPARVYLTGISMGGGGTWTVASRYADRFAAAAPICGAPPADDWDPARQLKTPTWALHARDDQAVPVRCSHDRISALLAEAGKPAPSYPAGGGDDAPADEQQDFDFADDALKLRYTEYPTGGHLIWAKAYATPAVIEWMFSHTRDTP